MNIKKKRNMFKLFFLMLFLTICSLGLYYYTTQYCNNKTDIIITEIIYLNNKKKAKDYCDLLNKAVINKDESAIKAISLLSFSDASHYDHGCVLVEIIFKIGEGKYLKSIRNLSLEEKVRVKNSLELGFAYGTKDYKHLLLEEAFPKVNVYLTEQ